MNNYFQKGNDDLIKEEYIQQEKESRAELDIKEVKNKNIIKSNCKEKISDTLDKDIEKEYFNIISELKIGNK